MPSLNPVLDALPAYPSVQLKAWKKTLRTRGGPLVDFGIGDPVERVPEFIRQALMDGVPTSSGYPSRQGAVAARASVAAYIERRFGVRVDPEEQVVLTLGGKEATHLIPRLLCDPSAPDNRVLLPDPGYPGYWRGAVLSGMEPVAMPLSADCRLRPWELPEETLRGARLMWLNSPHNPTGSVMSHDDLRRTWELCQEHDILLVNDECYADIYRGAPPPGLLEVATEGVLVLHSLSKRSGLTGYCSAAVSGDPAWIAALDKLRSNLSNGPQDFVNAATTVAWADDEHVRLRREVLGARVERMRRFMVEAGYEVLASEAALYLWVRAPDGLSGTQWAERLLEHGIVVAPGEFFGRSAGCHNFVRLAICGDDDELDAAIAHWRTVLEAS